jgi:very-short-patch-repair endonuclease
MDTGCEQRLWAQLRGRRLNGFKFVRQQPVGPFIADFACREAGLVVEVDGATHSTDEEVGYDARRTAYLQANGWRVLRLLNDDVATRMEDVLDTILMAVTR